MSVCNYIAPNNEKSMLYQRLEQKYGEAKSHDMWTAIRSQQFLNKHGDWTKITLSSNETEVMDKIAVTQATINENQTIIESSRAEEYKALAELEKPSIKLSLIPASTLVDQDDARLGIAHSKIVKEATALAQLMKCL